VSFSYAEIWQHMGAPAIAIAGVLLVMGLASLTVFLERLLTLHRSRSASRAFAAAVRDRLREGAIEAVVEDAATPAFARGHLPRLVRSALATYLHARTTADVSGLTPTERTRRHLERHAEQIGEDLRRGLPVLASVGSVAPFVGLLGTVVGIISAFQGIAATGSGGLSSVSAGISEALIETALGLAVAIPAVLAFNYLSTSIARDEGVLSRSSGELLDMIEDWEERSAEAEEGRRGRVA
jgi:biopolymer transport protein ExbB